MLTGTTLGSSAVVCEQRYCSRASGLMSAGCAQSCCRYVVGVLAKVKIACDMHTH